MQKTPSTRHRGRSLLPVSLFLLPLSMPSMAGEGGYGGYSSLAQREMVRRQQAVYDGDRLLGEGRDAYAKGEYQTAVDRYRQALTLVPDAPMFADRRRSYIEHLSDASVALSMQHRKVGKYAEARTLLEDVVKVDPANAEARRELAYLDDPIRTNPALTYEHTQNVDKVRRSLYMAEGNYDLGKYDQSLKEYESALRVDPYNSAARRGMERVAQAKRDYYKAAYDQTRAELLSQVDAAWELSVPEVLPEAATAPGLPTRDDSGMAYLTEKLRSIIIPEVNFEETTVEEAVAFLRQRSRELDVLELDPGRKGVNIVVRKPRATATAPSGSGDGLDAAEGATEPTDALPAEDPGSLKVKELVLTNVPLARVLDYICEQTRLKVKVDDYAVTLVPLREDDDLVTRTFSVPPDFQSSLEQQGSTAPEGGGDPFNETDQGGSKDLIKPRKPIKDLLTAAGVSFAVDGSSATLTGGGTVLIVRNTPSQIDQVEALIENTSKGSGKQVKITTKFVEITQENGEELGFDWIISPFGPMFGGNSIFGSGGSIGNGTPRVGNDFAGPLIPGVPTDGTLNVSNIVTAGNRSGDGAIIRNSIDGLLNNPDRTAQVLNVAPGIASLTGLFTDGEVKLIMRGLSQKKGVDLMTAPSVTAKTGGKAKIEIIREFIYPTEFEPPEIPQNLGGNTNGGFGGGGTPPTPIATPATPTAFETRNTGVTLEVEPTVGENDYLINLKFVPEIVEFEGFINYGSPIQTSVPILDAAGLQIGAQNVTITENRIEQPVFAVRRVDSEMTIYDGYTVAVGGLMRDDVQNVEDKVPVLGDIPLLGRLFQSKAETTIKSNLVVFLTAQLIDPTGRPVRGMDSGGTMPVSSGGDGVLPPLDLPPP